MTENLETQLLQLFDKLFQKQYLEKNVYIFNQMKSNLEIPVSLIFKERKIAQVTADEEVVLAALRKCNRVAVTEDGKTLRILIPLTKTKLTVQTDSKGMEQMRFFLDPTLPSGYRYDVDKSTVVVYGNDETQVATLKAALQKQGGYACTLDNSDPYADLKDSIDKAKQQKKERANYEAYQQSGAYGAPSMYGYNPYSGKFQRPRGTGFTRRAVESSDDEDTRRNDKKDVAREEKKEEKKQKVNKEHKDHKEYKEKECKETKESSKDKRPKYREKEAELKEHKEAKIEVEKRTRLNSQNFPEIEKEIEREVLRTKYTKAEIVDIYIREAPNIPMSAQLRDSNIPLLNPQGAFKLQAMKPGGRKQSTFDTPKVIIVPRKSSTTA